VTPEDLPRYQDFILPVIRAVAALGGSARAGEIEARVVADLAPSDEELDVVYPSRPSTSVFVDRAEWGRSYAKLIGALEQPKRGVFLLTPMGRELLASSDDEARRRITELDREYRRSRPRRAQQRGRTSRADEISEITAAVEEEVAEQGNTDVGAERWQDVLLRRLHRLPADGFEEFVLYVLREYELVLERVGGTGDEGIDGIGIAPISPVLSSRVAVQVKRYDPDGRPVGRDVVALFQRDAQTKGAERAILVTLGRFTEAARKAATATMPTVDLVDGERLAELVLAKEIGVRLAPRVNEAWFDRFDE
jgi:restriction system protein